MVRVAICENQGQDLNCITKLLEQSGESVDITVYASGEPLLWDIRTGRVYFDLFFVGNRVNQMDGTEIIKGIRLIDEDATVIFLAPFGAFEKESQQPMVFGVLVRPVSETPLERMLERALEQVKQAQEQVISINTHSHSYPVRYAHIAYIANENRKIIIHLRNAETRQYGGKFSDFVSLLQNGHFARCHKNFIVNLSCVTQMTAEAFWLGEVMLPISRKYRKAAQERYHNHLFTVFNQD